MSSIKTAKRITIVSVVFSLVMVVGFAALAFINLKANTAKADAVITMVKSVDQNLVTAGTTVTYTYTIGYTGDFQPEVTLTDLTDNKLGLIDIASNCTNSGVLNGPDVVCTTTAPISQDITNNATVTGIYPSPTGGGDIQVSDTSNEVLVRVLPTITVEKTANPTTITEDSTVTYTVSVTNNGSNELDIITLQSLIDNIYGDLDGVGDCKVGEEVTINPGNTYTCSFEEELTCNNGDSVTDIVTANTIYSSREDGDIVISDSDDATVNIACDEPAIEVTKTADPTSISEDTEVDYTVTVTNNIGLTGTLETLSDDVYGDLNGLGDCVTGGTINDGNTYTCTFPGDVLCADEPSVVDTVTAEVSYTDELGEILTLSDQASATVNVACEEEPYCGDGNLDSGEECDDNNNTDGDGCSSTCTNEEDDENGVEPGLATIHGKVYNDANQNGTLDVSESGIGNVTVNLLNNSGSSLETDQTDSNGDFSFNELDPNTYALRETDLAGYMSSTPNDITGITVAANDSSYHLFGDYMEEEEETSPTTSTAPTSTPTTPTTSAALPTTGPGDNPYPLFAALALIPLIASGYAFYRYKRK